jgi:AraC-like DNA-binding protein
MEWSRSLCRPDLPGVETLHASFRTHRYVRHAHEHAVIGLVETGVQSFRYRGERHLTGPGGIFFVNPGEAHTGEAAEPDGYTYRGLYPTRWFLDDVMAGRADGRLCFRDAVLYDPWLFTALRRTHRAVVDGAPRLTCEALLLQSVAGLLERNGAPATPAGKLRPARGAVRRVREFIDAQPGGDISLVSLARLAGMSPFHLAHAFARDVGAPVHVYAEAVRMRRARELLRDTAPLAEIALELGYADQSHFSRRFKQHRGVTPGQYRRSARYDKTDPRGSTRV